MRFALEIIEYIRGKVGKDFPIIYRFSADEYVPDGITLEESRLIAKKLEEAGVDALHVVASHMDVAHRALPPMGTTPEGCFIPFAEELKKMVAIPIITTGRIKSPEVAERILEEGKADFIAMARQLIADPEWPNKVKVGKLDEIRMCIGCNLGCVGNAALLAGRDMKCSINASVGKEKDYKITPVQKPRKVMVIGGGPAGMEIARVAALRGHNVVLFEKQRRLGGQLLLASVSPYKTEVGYLTKYLNTQLEKLGVDVRLEQEATPPTVTDVEPDVLVIATGATQLSPQIPGIEGTNVYFAWDVLAGKFEVRGNKVVVVGGGSVGCDIAEYLALKGKEVTIVEQYPKIGLTLESLMRACFLERFARYGVTTLTERQLIQITGQGVIVVDKNGKAENVEVDSVVIALGSTPNDELAEVLKDIPVELHTIGDAVEPRRIMDAISEGAFIGRQV